jgi:histidinol-phosphate aminotransferase
MDLKRFIKPNILSLTAYDPGTINCKIKLDANESPYGFSIRYTTDCAQDILAIDTNRYPDSKAAGLREFIASSLDIEHESMIFGNGSDELIYSLIAAVGGPVLCPTPTFSMYSIISRILNQEILTIPLDSDFDIDIDLMFKTALQFDVKLIFLSSPNNPTGNCFGREKILTLIEKTDAIVIVDEAYQQFSGIESFIPLVKKYERLAVFRTLSKIGLAALRIGFMIASPELIKEVNKVRLPFNINSISQETALRVLRDGLSIESFIDEIIRGREYLFSGLLKIKGIKPYPSEANFILFGVDDTTCGLNAEEVFNRLIEQDILVRNLISQIKGCLRVTVGTENENEVFLEALREIVIKCRV